MSYCVSCTSLTVRLAVCIVCCATGDEDKNIYIYNANVLSFPLACISWSRLVHHHHHHISFMELGHLWTHSGLTYPEVSSKVYHDSFCQLWSSISFSWVTYFEAFYLHVVSSFSCIPVICPKFVLFLTPLQFVHLFCNLSICILLFFSCISYPLLLFFWRHLL